MASLSKHLEGLWLGRLAASEWHLQFAFMTKLPTVGSGIRGEYFHRLCLKPTQLMWAHFFPILCLHHSWPRNIESNNNLSILATFCKSNWVLLRIWIWPKNPMLRLSIHFFAICYFLLCARSPDHCSVSENNWCIEFFLWRQCYVRPNGKGRIYIQNSETGFHETAKLKIAISDQRQLFNVRRLFLAAYYVKLSKNTWLTVLFKHL